METRGWRAVECTSLVSQIKYQWGPDQSNQEAEKLTSRMSGELLPLAHDNSKNALGTLAQQMDHVLTARWKVDLVNVSIVSQGTKSRW